MCGFWILRIGKIFSIKKERRCDYVSERVESGLGLPVSGCSSIRAAENQVYTVGLNRASGDVEYCGNTTVSNPDGTTLARLCTSEESYTRVVLKKECLEKAKETIPWRLMRREEVYNKI